MVSTYCNIFLSHFPCFQISDKLTVDYFSVIVRCKMHEGNENDVYIESAEAGCKLFYKDVAYTRDLPIRA